MVHQVADVRCTHDLHLPVPTLAGDRAEVVTVPPTAELRSYVQDLVRRAEQVRNRACAPDEDNMLKVTGDGRRAALDLRLVGLAATSATKVATAAGRIAAIYGTTRQNAYQDETGRPHPRPGALQLVFCDQGTPAPGWNVYEELRRSLAARGVPAGAVRFVHEATTDRAKAQLFAACRDGRVAVLVGSTERMGVGTNVQARAVALHHLDCPWRPADIEQREGRILRQGNQNAEVTILRYVTEGSFDVYLWQTVERKAAFIAQVMRGGDVGRDMDDVGEAALSYAEVKALATGNPLVLEAAGLDAELAKLRRLLRPESWTRPAGASPVRVSVGAPGSRPRSGAERRRAERGVKSLFGGSKRAGRSATRRESCSLVTYTTGEPSRSCHGEGPCPTDWRSEMPSVGSLRGTGSGTYARSGSEQERPVCAASSAKTARISQW